MLKSWGRIKPCHRIEDIIVRVEAKADHKNPMRMKLHSTHPYCKYEYEVRHRAGYTTMSIESIENIESGKYSPILKFICNIRTDIVRCNFFELNSERAKIVKGNVFKVRK